MFSQLNGRSPTNTNLKSDLSLLNLIIFILFSRSLIKDSLTINLLPHTIHKSLSPFLPFSTQGTILRGPRLLSTVDFLRLNF